MRLINHERLTGDMSGIWGNAENVTGDVTGITGDVSLISGDLSEFEGDTAELFFFAEEEGLLDSEYYGWY